jgi:hypothetical protein
MATVSKKEIKTEPIHIIIEGVKATVTTEDSTSGVKKQHVLYTKDLFENMSQLVDSTKQRSGTMFTPYGSDYAVVKYWEETKNGFLIQVAEASPSIRTFNMVNFRGVLEEEGMSTKDYPLKLATPNTLITKIHWPYTFMITIFQKASGQWRTRDGYIAWGDEPMKDMTTPIYGLQLPNTYGPDRSGHQKPPYRICWGGVAAFANCHTENGASLIPIFYSSNFNLDLVPHTFFTRQLPRYAHELLVKDTSLYQGRITLNYLKNLGNGGNPITVGSMGDAIARIRSGVGGRD